MATTVLPMTPATISSETGRPLRVAYVISAFQTAQAGTEGHLLRLIRQIDRRRVDPQLIVLQDSDWTRSFHDPQVPLTTLGFRSFWNPRDWGCVGRLARLFELFRPTLSSCTPPMLISPAALPLAGPACPSSSPAAAIWDIS